jgi:predicted phage terminase large subunit-like protein
MSFNLGKRGGKRRFIGTRYHFNDTYATIIEEKIAKPRIHVATEDGTVTGKPVFLSQEELLKKRVDMGPYIFSSQMLMNPIADEAQNFNVDWLRWYDDADDGLGYNKYILVDAANEKKKDSDYTSMWVIGLGEDKNAVALDLVWDRLSLSGRARELIDLHKKWSDDDSPIIQVRYEQYGLMADIEHIQSQMTREKYRFDITKVGGATAKDDRIKRLVPWFEQGRIWLPRTLHRTIYDGTTVDLMRTFKEHEYKPFPVCRHKDLLDSLARLAEPKMKLKYPKKGGTSKLRTTPGPGKSEHAWMAG